MIGYISKIETFGLLDGPGVRVVVFTSGCSLRCLYCHNPEMFNVSSGKEYTVEKLVDYILKYKSYIKDGGVTFSGGEPLLQSKYLIEVCKKLKEHDIHVALDTAGVGEHSLELLNLVDLVIFDIKHISENDYKYITGMPIAKSLEFLGKVQDLNKKMWLRSVIVPGINDTDEYIEKLADFITKLKNIERIELLPYHTGAINKYKELGIDYKLNGIPNMDINTCKKLEENLKSLIKY